MGVTLIAIVAEGNKGRIYCAPNDQQVKIAQSGLASWRPDMKMNQDCKDLVSGRGYGYTEWHELFSERQLVALTTFSDLIHEARAQIEQKALIAGLSNDQTPLRDGGIGAKAYAEAVSVYLGFAVGRASDA